MAPITASHGAAMATTPPAMAPAVNGTDRNTSPFSQRLCSLRTWPSATRRLTSSTSWLPATSISSVKVFQALFGSSVIGLLHVDGRRMTDARPSRLDPGQTGSGLT